ncbi:hypothetical protein BOX15_Mlig014823g1, partial [Macrostomum lignano]
TQAITRHHLQRLLRLAGERVRGRLYLCLERAPLTPRTISLCYSQPTRPGLDVRYLHPDWPKHAGRVCDLLMHDCPSLSPGQAVDLANRYLAGRPGMAEALTVEHPEPEEPEEDLADPDWRPDQFANVALGGTFDRLHSGHKILLATGALLASRVLTIGITGPGLLGNKVLPDLIQSYRERAAAVVDFLADTRPDGPVYHVTELAEPLGPPARQADYQALVASPETRSGCGRINAARTAAGWPELPVHCVPFAQEEEGATPAPINETKLSSSTGRYRLLGAPLRPPLRPPVPGRPYVLGLTGGSGSGKSSVGRRLAGLGARVVDCDRLGHAAYAPGTACHRRLLAEFGPEIAPDGPDGAIDRKALGRRVFADQSARQRLNDIVWPEIRRLALEAVHSGPQSASPDVVVLDAAVLLEAEWQCLCHEVWLCLIPKREAVKRLTERDGLTEEAAQARLAAQLTDADRLSWASVALCTLWEPEATQAQVELAWKRLLRERLGATPGPQSNL